MKLDLLPFLMSSIVLFSGVLAPACAENNYSKHIGGKLKLNQVTNMSNGCPDAVTGLISKPSELIIAADGTTAPCNVKIRPRKPLSTHVSENKKWAEYNRAILESDFDRIIVLFKNCAEANDGLCQYLLAEGVSEWLSRTDVKKNKKYDVDFVLKWLRKALRSDSARQLVAGSLVGYFSNGYRGFPRDDTIAKCWLDVANFSKSVLNGKLKYMAKHCEDMSVRKYGFVW
jgi:hypothetical protein